MARALELMIAVNFKATPLSIITRAQTQAILAFVVSLDGNLTISVAKHRGLCGVARFATFGRTKAPRPNSDARHLQPLGERTMAKNTKVRGLRSVLLYRGDFLDSRMVGIVHFQHP